MIRSPMTLQTFLERRKKITEKEPQLRVLCPKCIQPEFGCYCDHIKPFDSKINFVILIHPIEMKRRIATGRMSHMSLIGSHLIMGQNYSQDRRVNALIEDSNYHSVILYPGLHSMNLSPLSETHRGSLFPKNKKLRIFVVDGTWNTARTMMNQSSNLNTLPRICFSPAKPSNFRVRKQPHPACYSTIEAIHHTIDLIGSSQGFDLSTREHDQLIHTFDKMVELQLEFIKKAHAKFGAYASRRVKNKSA